MFSYLDVDVRITNELTGYNIFRTKICTDALNPMNHVLTYI